MIEVSIATFVLGLISLIMGALITGAGIGLIIMRKREAKKNG